MRSQWNNDLVDVFAADFLSQEHFACTDIDSIKKAFTTHLFTLRSQYNRIKNNNQLTENDRRRLSMAAQLKRRKTVS